MPEHIRRISDTARVFGFGSAALDFRIGTADLGPDYRDKLLAQQCDALGGGAIANCMVQIARLGGEAVWLGKLGTDWIGDRILSDLAGEGVACHLVVRDAACCSPFNVAVYAGFQRRRVGGFLLPNSLATVTPEHLAGWARRFRSSDWLLAEIGELPLAAVESLCRAAGERGARVAIDVDLDPVVQCGADADQVRALLSLADLLVPNVQAMSTLYPELAPPDLASRLADEFQTTAVVTAGAAGAYFCRWRGSVEHRPPVPTEVVDTVGAGDAFHGGLLDACARGEPIEKAVELAARCGAEACRRFGARAGLPTAEQLGLPDRQSM